MKLERCLTGTLKEMRAAQVATDKALGYPRKGIQVGGGIHVNMPEAWDGKGECPPGWTRTASEPVVGADGVAYLAVTGNEMGLIDPSNLTKVTAGERLLLGKVAQAELFDLKSIVNEAVAAEEAKAEATPIGVKVAAGVGIVAAAFELAQQLGLF